MLDARTNEWLSRLQTNAPKLVMLLLGALIAVDLGRIALAFLNKPVKSPQPVQTRSAGRQAEGINMQAVIAAHLFGNAEPKLARGNPEDAQLSSANLILAGTIATEDPKRGVAIVSDAGAPSKVYSVGDNISGASLHSVYLDYVILDRNGSLEKLKLPRELPASMRGTVPPAYRPPVAADPRTAAAVDNIRKMVQRDPGILDQVMRTVPSYDNAAGKLRGFRAYPGRNRQIFGRLGLKSGDLVTAINGTPLDDPQRSQEVFNTIQTSDHVTVTVDRAGQRQDITLNIAQVAAQAEEDLKDPNSVEKLQNQANPNPADPSNGNPGALPPGVPPPNPQGPSQEIR